MRDLNWFQAQFLAHRGEFIRRQYAYYSGYNRGFVYRGGLWYCADGYYQNYLQSNSRVAQAPDFTSVDFFATDWTNEPWGSTAETPGVRPPAGGGFGPASIPLGYNLAELEDEAPPDLRAEQTITVADPTPSIVVGGGAITPATASSGLAVIYTPQQVGVVTGGASITPVAAGTIYVNITQPGNGSFKAAPAVNCLVTVVDLRLAQYISFPELPPQPLSDIPIMPAYASSGLAVTYASSDTAVATGGAMVSIVGLGFATITASQAGDTYTRPAPDVTQALTVLPNAEILRDSDEVVLYSAPGVAQQPVLVAAVSAATVLTGARIDFHLSHCYLASGSLAGAVITAPTDSVTFSGATLTGSQWLQGVAEYAHSINNFYGAAMAGSFFSSRSFFTGCNFSYANLATATAIYARFWYCNFTGATITGTVFAVVAGQACGFLYSVFTSANLSNSDFTGATFVSCNFLNANLTNVDFTNASFSGCFFTGATTTGANFTGAVGGP